MTDELVHIVLASTSVETRIRIAFVHIAQASRVVEAARTRTLESIRQIVTFASVRTR